MKIRFLRDVSVDVEKPRLKEVWDKTFSRWTELKVEQVYVEGSVATLKTYEGDVLVAVPIDSFMEIPEEKKTFVL